MKPFCSLLSFIASRDIRCGWQVLETGCIYCMQVTMRYMIKIIGELMEKAFIHWIVTKNNCVYVRSLSRKKLRSHCRFQQNRYWPYEFRLNAPCNPSVTLK